MNSIELNIAVHTIYSNTIIFRRLQIAIEKHQRLQEIIKEIELPKLLDPTMDPERVWKRCLEEISEHVGLQSV